MVCMIGDKISMNSNFIIGMVHYQNEILGNSVMIVLAMYLLTTVTLACVMLHNPCALNVSILDLQRVQSMWESTHSCSDGTCVLSNR